MDEPAYDFLLLKERRVYLFAALLADSSFGEKERLTQSLAIAVY
jgi:hypothetical protein